jgi:inorganic pyrophosphatase/exopolyphosphatase
MEDLLVGNTILDTLLLREPNSMEQDTTVARAQQWGMDLRTAVEDRERKEASGE